MRKVSLIVPFAALCAGSLATTTASADESTSVSGQIFADFTHQDVQLAGKEVAPSGWGIDVKRAYIGIDHKFDDIWSANVTTDFNFSGATGQNTTQVYIKYAYLQAKLSDLFAVRLGNTALPWIPYVENLYGYRFVENTLIDRLKFGQTTDYSVGLAGTSPYANYAVSALQGNGYKGGVTPSRTKTLDTEARIGLTPIPGLVFAVGGYQGHVGKDPVGTTPTPHTATRFDAVGGYVGYGLRIGAEYFRANDWGNNANEVAGTNAPDHADGESAWISYDFTKQFGVFARGDWANLREVLAPKFTDNYFNVGVVDHVKKNLDVALVYKHEEVDNPTTGLSSSNPSIGYQGGGTLGAAGENGKFDEVGVFVRVAY